MTEQTVPAGEAREKFAELLEAVELHRVMVTKHGSPKAYLVSVREFRALEETVQVLENQQLMEEIAKGLADVRAGRTRDARDVFAELDAEFGV